MGTQSVVNITSRSSLLEIFREGLTGWKDMWVQRNHTNWQGGSHGFARLCTLSLDTSNPIGTGGRKKIVLVSYVTEATVEIYGPSFTLRAQKVASGHYLPHPLIFYFEVPSATERIGFVSRGH